MTKAIKLTQYQGNIIRALRGLELHDHELPVPSDRQVVIEVEAAPCNPSDLAFIQGGYNVRKTLPAIPGFEGSGKVISTGDHPDAHNLLHKRVSFFTQSDATGSWAGQTLAEADDCIMLLEDMPSEQAACFSVNPFTAYAMVEVARQNKSISIIQNAAGGQVARFVNRLAKNAGIEVINIVRKTEHKELLAREGFENILCSSDETFAEELFAEAQELNANLAFDAVGGEQSGIILKAMPANSTLLLYGALGARTLSEIPATDVIFRKKHISGFNMNEWKSKLSKDRFEQISLQLQKQFIDKSLETKIQESFKLEDYGQALMQYIRNMSGGKIVLRP